VPSPPIKYERPDGKLYAPETWNAKKKDVHEEADETCR